MKIFHRFFLWALSLCLLTEPLAVYAQEDAYLLIDQSDGYEESFTSYEAAYDAFEAQKEEHENLLIRQDDKILAMEYGIIEFDSDEACTLILEYDSLSKNEKDYFNGCYGIDGLYIGTDRNQRVSFQIAGDIGRIAIDDVRLIPLEDLKTRITSYTVKDGKLIHNIRTQSELDFFTYSIVLDEAPQGLKEGQTCYSFDGHYFYEDLELLRDDLQSEAHEHSLNAEAYYNYFQYLPYRSYTSYSREELTSYLNDILGVTGRPDHYQDLDGDKADDVIDRSQLYGNIDEFFAAESLFGANALSQLAAAIHESSYGRSPDSYNRNDLYDLAVYESDEESETKRYSSIADSIYSHARYYISARFADHRRSDYRGTFFGDKASGINVDYSIDPYYGEKCASLCYKIDESLGGKDKGRYASILIKDQDHLVFYRDEGLDRRYFTLSDVNELHLIVLEENESAYKVRIDQSYSDGYFYDPSFSVAYLPKERVSQVFNADEMKEETFENTTLDLDGGTYHGLQELTVFEENKDAFIPHKEAHEFLGFDEDNKAVYKKIVKIELVNTSRDKTIQAEPVDLRDLSLKVFYEDGTNADIALNTDMVRVEEEDETLIIEYEGMRLERKIPYSDRLQKQYEALEKAVSENDASAIKKNLYGIDYPFTFSQIRDYDQTLKEKNKRNYVILDKDSDNDLSISGLDLSLDDKISLSLMADTYYVMVEEIKEEDRNKIYDLAKGYGFDYEEGIDISFRFNYQSIGLRGPAIVQLAVKDARKDAVYSIYHLDQDGNIVKCRTTRTKNYVQFLIEDSGPYVLLSLNGVNEFDIQDGIEDLSYENMGFDKHRTNFELMGTLVIVLTGLIGITLYYIIYNERKRMWKDFRRSLQQAGTVQDEAPKN